jgi:hypothetical protein
MYVWQNGTKISDVTFVRASTRICQWHWGAYASGDNDNVVLYEDDNSIWKLQQAWTDFAREPLCQGAAAVAPARPKVAEPAGHVYCFSRAEHRQWVVTWQSRGTE